MKVFIWIFLLAFVIALTLTAETDWQEVVDAEGYAFVLEEPPVANGSAPAETKQAPAGSVSESGRHALRRELLKEVEDAWMRPQSHERNIRASVEDRNEAMLQRMRTIQIPRVELHDLPLSEALEVISSLSEQFDPAGTGINIVQMGNRDAEPRLFITLRELHLERILELVSQSVGYEFIPERDTVIVRPAEGIGRFLETEFYPLTRSTLIRLTGKEDAGYARIAESTEVDENAAQEWQPERRMEDSLRQFLQRAGVPFASVEGATLALADSQLIVTQTARNLEKIRNILRRYSEIKQVEIETRFIEVQDKNLEELGFSWHAASGGSPEFTSDGLPVIDADGRQRLIRRNQFGNRSTRSLADTFTGGDSGSGIGIDRPGYSLPFIPQGAPNLPTTVDLASDAGNLANLSGVVSEVDVDLIIRALERQTGNDLLSAPRITVLSGKTAEIVVAQEFRYPEMYGDISADVGRGDSTSGSAGVAITAGTPREFTVRNIGVEMLVSPMVEENDAISLRLEPVVTEFEGFVEYGGTSIAIASDTTVTVPSGFYQPVFSVRKLKTEVTIWDGATVVMGGLTREQVVRVSDKIPLLGDIPLIGKLFRSEGESSQKRNLLIFVTANLVSPGGTPLRQMSGWQEKSALNKESNE